MSETVKMPALGESVTEGTVTRWLKGVGDTVDVDEPLLEVSTDKVDTEIPSPVAEIGRAARGDGVEIAEVGAERVDIGDVTRAESDGCVGSGAGAAGGQDAPATDERPPSGESEEPAAAESGSCGGAACGAAVTLPALGEAVTEGPVTRWLKEVGDTVDVDEPLLEVSTDKVDTEIPSPVA